MEELDENGDGEIDFQEFMAMMTHQARVNCSIFVVVSGFGGLVFGMVPDVTRLHKLCESGYWLLRAWCRSFGGWELNRRKSGNGGG